MISFIESVPPSFLQRNKSDSAGEHSPSLDTANGPSNMSVAEKGSSKSSSSLVFGYLNLFSDGVVGVPSYFCTDLEFG